jgi:hypothetical protein
MPEIERETTFYSFFDEEFPSEISFSCIQKGIKRRVVMLLHYYYSYN